MTAAEVITCLTEARLRRGLTLRDVAARSPLLSAAHLSNLERGQKSPGILVLEAWAAALDCRLELDLLALRPLL